MVKEYENFRITFWVTSVQTQNCYWNASRVGCLPPEPEDILLLPELLLPWLSLY